MTHAPPLIEVKLCGLRSVSDVLAAARAGATYAGIVLVPDARRRVDDVTARAMVDALAATDTSPVAVLGGDLADVDALQLVQRLGITRVQLVGSDQGALQLARILDGFELVRALGVPGSGVDVAEQARAWEARGARIVFDAPATGSELGGTGRRVDPALLRELVTGTRGVAGGLTAENVGDIVRRLRPALVDVSSGIEDGGGRKAADRMRAFVERARAAAVETAMAGPGPQLGRERA